MADGVLVVNDSPLILLAAIDELPLLPRLAGEILVPAAVVREVRAGRDPHPALLRLETTTGLRIVHSLPIPEDIGGWDLGPGRGRVAGAGARRLSPRLGGGARRSPGAALCRVARSAGHGHAGHRAPSQAARLDPRRSPPRRAPPGAAALSLGRARRSGSRRDRGVSLLFTGPGPAPSPAARSTCRSWPWPRGPSGARRPRASWHRRRCRP